MAVDDGDQGAAAGGSILTRKTGPLPNWVWMALLLLVALIYSFWQRNRAAEVPLEEDNGPSVENVPGDQTPPPVFILPQAPQPSVTVPVTVNTPAPAPPAAGRPTPPVTPPKPAAPVPKPAAPAYQTVSVAKYTSKNPPWNSTIWGIAKQYGYGAAANNWSSIWNDPKNAALKAKRKDPKKIQPGDKIYVRKR
jgi:hypothetical protein